MEVVPEMRENLGHAVRLAPFPEASGRPHEVPLERRIRGRVRSSELRVELVDHAADLGIGAVELLGEELHVGRERQSKRASAQAPGTSDRGVSSGAERSAIERARRGDAAPHAGDESRRGR